ncbi:MAG: Vacuolar protein sorting-associated protein 8 [Bathelium mastoideum]|nr:MAG: Vacuolar protein sorting-associated protein 8 [Bathelium mastoideum]
MSAASGDSGGGGENEDVLADELAREQDLRQSGLEEDDGPLVESGNNAGDLDDQGSGFGDFVPVQDNHGLKPGVVESGFPSSPNESLSIPDDTPSVQGSLLSSPGSSVPASRATPSRTASGSLLPFDRRFQSRLSSSPLQSPRTLSPAFLSPGSRQSSLSSNLPGIGGDKDAEHDTPQAPWEVVRWSKLKKITGQVFSEVGKRNFGRPTCLAVAASLVIGTSKGYILAFDYQQTLKVIIGPGTQAAESGSVTSVAISADYSTVAGGHTNGSIFTWELARPAKPFLQISPIDRALMDKRHGDGHVSGSAILHVGFLGTRHTALVSADDGGMAFSHLATRGLGPVARTIKTTRILGRYPPGSQPEDKPRRPSSVLAFSALPLGNVERPTDSMGLTALLTPYLLVIVSTTPVAQTQYKAPRPKEIAPHSAMSGCLAWFPAVKLKGQDAEPSASRSLTKLVYCWSNVLTILDVEDTEKTDETEREKPPSLHFRPRSRWKSEEAIVAVQWLSRSVLGILTISQRLLILEDASLRVTDSFDLLYKHIYHHDLFSQQLQSVVDNLDEDDVSLHGVVADAFYMSFRAYKGRLFLLGFNDISIGTLSNWADRLVALMEEGDFIGAISLATSYYTGDADRLTVGLPEDDISRHSMVQEKLLDMVSASTTYQLGRFAPDEADDSARGQVQQLTVESLKACINMDQLDFLLTDIYEQYEEASSESILLEALEPAILDGQVTTLPPTLFKDLITHFTLIGQDTRLEEMICRLDATTLDIDSAATLFKQHNLYDALIHLWNQAVGDYVTPLVELLSLIQFVQINDQEHSGDVDSIYQESAMKVFPYLAFILTGRIYPGSGSLSEVDATRAQTDLYNFLFSSKVTRWPKKGGKLIRTTNKEEPEPSFPYLRLLLHFDTSSFMSMLNEAFEDSFLNGSHEQLTNGRDGHPSGYQEDDSGPSVTRQYIISVLLKIMNQAEYSAQNTVFLNMFIARNIPKFPQFILLSGSQLHNILVGLCQYPSLDSAADCQLSVEYLLSVYHPSDLKSLVPLFQRAGFYRILKSIYRSEGEFASLLGTYFEDAEDRDAVFNCIGDCLRSNTEITKKQRQEVEEVIVDHAKDLVAIDTAKAARVIRDSAPHIVHAVLSALDDSRNQYNFLQTLLETGVTDTDQIISGTPTISSELIEHYVQLMCRYNSAHVADYVTQLKSGDLRLGSVLPEMERSGVIDAAIVLMARDGLVRDAMARLIKHLGTLDVALTGLVDAAPESPDADNTEEAARDLFEDVEKYAKVGIWLCQGQTKLSKRPATVERKASLQIREEDLTFDEKLWLDLLDAVFAVTQHVSASAHRTDSDTTLDTTKIILSLRNTTQHTFTALLATFATPSTSSKSQHPSAVRKSSPHPSRSRSQSASRRAPQEASASFLHILTAFLARAAATSPTLADLRLVLTDIFAAYAFESTLLALTTQLLDADVFGSVARLHEERQRGWRPRVGGTSGGGAGGRCEGCERRAWGAGVDAGEGGGGVFAAWEEQREKEGLRRRGRWGGGAAGKSGVQLRGEGKRRDVGSEREHVVDDNRSEGHGKDGGDGEESSGENNEEDGKGGGGLGPLVVFACRHLFHKRCLKPQLSSDQQQKGHGGKGSSGADEASAHTAAEPHRHLQCPLCN